MTFKNQTIQMVQVSIEQVTNISSLKTCNRVSFFSYHLDGQTMWWLYFKIICQGNVSSINDEGINSSRMNNTKSFSIFF